MREGLIKLIKELGGFDDATRVKEAGVLQDELREAMGMVSTVRALSAEAAIAKDGVAAAALKSDTTQHGIRTLAEGVLP